MSHRTVNEIIYKIQEYNSMNGKVFAPKKVEEYPRGHLANLPCALTYPGEGEFSTKILGDKVKHSRTYVIRVFASEQTGIQSEAEAEAMSWLTDFGFLWGGMSLLDSNPELSMDKSEGRYVLDSGVLEYMEYAGEMYYGFEVYIRVYEKS